MCMQIRVALTSRVLEPRATSSIIGAVTVTAGTDGGANAIEEAWFRSERRVR
jgi:hypothetical protein